MFLLVYLPGKICCYYWLVLPLFHFLSDLPAILRLHFVEPEVALLYDACQSSSSYLDVMFLLCLVVVVYVEELLARFLVVLVSLS